MEEIIIHGNSSEELKNLAGNSVDSVVTDPPYGLSKEPNINEVLTKWLAGEDYSHSGGGFMGKTWDSFVPGPSVWREVYRVLKPGGHALIFAGTRTQDLMTTALRLAGFEVRDVIEWIYFSGFPKSMDVSKAFDKRAGAEREVIGEKLVGNAKANGSWANGFLEGTTGGTHLAPITAPTTGLARKWDGWGTSLKPAHEPIILVRKPLEKTVCNTVEIYGTGAININECRIGDEEIRSSGEVSNAWREAEGREDRQTPNPKTHVGRFPANIATTEIDAFYSPYFNVTPKELSKKASKGDKNSDWEGGKIDGNRHPTVKPIDLMAWLVRLITPPGGTTLDPFAGSGSTLVAAKREGFGFIGIEREEEYVEIIKARIGA
jgi:site-specific DNA-methyltransferase (adenine-specific)